MTNPTPKRGGARPGAGRKPNPDTPPMERITIRVPPATAAAMRDDTEGARGALNAWADGDAPAPPTKRKRKP